MTVGKFRLMGDAVEGPAAYMTERGNALIDRIVSDQDAMFNMTAHLSPSAEVAVLVRLQTDYAAWVGEKQLLGWTK